MKRLSYFLAAAFAMSHVSAQTALDLNEGSILYYDPVYEDFDFSWFGKDGRTYFVQTSTTLTDWIYVPNIIESGEDAVLNYGFYYSFPAPHKGFFLRLAYTDAPWSEDFDGDGYDNEFELDLGTDPLDATDDDSNGIPDDIDAVWSGVASAWKLAIVNDANAAYYDPDGSINAENDLKPGDDYDGDGKSNLSEWHYGTGAADFFNDQEVFIQVASGDSEIGPPNSYLGSLISVKLYNSFGATIQGAPVIFSAVAGSLSEDDTTNTPLVSSFRALTDTDGAKVAYFTPSSPGTDTITASLPDGTSIDITVYTVSAADAAKPSLSNFQMTDNQDGTYTYTWVSEADNGDWFKIQDKASGNTWVTIYETTYGSSELPYVSGQNSYSLTLDEANNFVSN